jgi:short-subunit dehydrogenase
VLDTNVYGMVATFQPFVTPMREARRGALVGVASIAGYRGLPGAGAYCGSKAAAIAYLESLRVEMFGTGVAVVTICPGFIATPMTADNPYRMPFLTPPGIAARSIARAIARGARFHVVPWQMAWVGRALRLVPRPLYDRLLANRPRKPRRPG